MRKSLFTAALVAFSLLLVSCSTEKKISVDAGSNWKINYTDNSAFSAADFNDTNWEKTGLKKIYRKDSHILWLRNTLSVPSSIPSNNLWLGIGKTNSAIEIYADGIYIGTRGSMPENGENVRIEENTEFLIPENCIHDGKVTIAMRVYIPGNSVHDINCTLDNHGQAYFQNSIKNIFNQRIFFAIGVLSILIMLYALMEFFMDMKDTTFIYFVFCLLAIILYFFDMGTEHLILPFNIQRSITRSCLCISMGFMNIFLNKFFKRGKTKLCFILDTSIPAVMLLAFILSTGNDDLVDTLFLISMLPVVASIVYGFIVTIHAAKLKQHDSVPLIIGFVLGSMFAIHDVIYQILGKVPFMWIQGFAFFSLDLSVFITLVRREARIKKEVQRLAESDRIQKEKLSHIIESARNMATESNEISISLNKSVDSVVHASTRTKEKVNDIDKAITEQTRIREETDKAVKQLTEFLSSINREFDRETEIISSTATETRQVIQGIETVGDGISTAAEFTSSLSTLTKVGSEDMKRLMTVMEKIQSSSKEILGVVTTLDDFAQQTDLLSMNASIEAAHSGEAGKGFSVIAHEIKNLAAQTQQWSAKIGEIITSVIKEIEDSVELTTKVNQALQQIEEGSVLSAEKVNAASAGMKTQQIAGARIASESQELAQSASKMRDEVTNQSAFSSQVLGNMQDLQNASLSVDNASSEISRETMLLSDEAKNLMELAKRTAEASKLLLELMGQQV